MTQSLLAGRLQMRAHREVRQVAGYELPPRAVGPSCADKKEAAAICDALMSADFWLRHLRDSRCYAPFVMAATRLQVREMPGPRNPA